MHFRIGYTMNYIFRSSIGCEIMLLIKARIRLIFSRYKTVQAVLSLFCALYANQFKCGVFIMCIICKSVQAALSLLCALYANQFKLCCLYYMHYMQISSRCVVFIMCIICHCDQAVISL